MAKSRKSAKKSTVKKSGLAVLAAAASAAVAQHVADTYANASQADGQAIDPSESLGFKPSQDSEVPGQPLDVAALFEDSTVPQILSVDSFEVADLTVSNPDVFLLAQASNTTSPEVAAVDAAESSPVSASAEAGAMSSAAGALPVLGGLGLLAIAAGGGGSGGGVIDAGTSGVVVDGYLSGALVERVNGSHNQNTEIRTNSEGAFSGLTGSGPIKVTGGIDMSTNQPFTGVLFAPAGSTMVTPVTTLVHALVETGQTVDQATAAITQKLGLPSGFDIFTQDPFALAEAGNTDALKVFQAGSAIATTLQALAGGDAASFESLAATLAQQVSDSIGPFVLDADSIQALATAGSVTFSFVSELAKGVADINSATNVNAVASAQGSTLETTNPDLFSSATANGILNLSDRSDFEREGLDEDQFSVGEADDSTITLKTSLAGLAGLGIDQVTGEKDQSVVVQGVGAQGATLQSPNFAGNLNVTLQLQASDAAADGVVDSTITLKTSLAGLVDLGIDKVVGEKGQNVVIGGHSGSFEGLQALIEGAAAGGETFFASDLNVTKLFDEDAEGTVAIEGITLKDLAVLGIDSIDVRQGEVDSITIAVGGTASEGVTGAQAAAEKLLAIVKLFIENGATTDNSPVFDTKDAVTLDFGGTDPAVEFNNLSNQFKAVFDGFKSGEETGFGAAMKLLGLDDNDKFLL